MPVKLLLPTVLELSERTWRYLLVHDGRQLSWIGPANLDITGRVRIDRHSTTLELYREDQLLVCQRSLL